MGEDSRRAWGLVAGVELASEIDVPEGARLRFSFVQPELLRTGDAPLALVARITGGDDSQDLRLPVARPEGGCRWQEHALPHEGFGGQRVRIAFRLEGGPDEVIALGQPLLCVDPERAEPMTTLLVTSDTHRGDHVGPAREGVGVRTPFLDGLAARGAFFEDCWSTSNVTRPSHIALLTCVSPRDTRVVTNFRRLGEEAVTLTEVFRDAGWLTYAAVSGTPLDDRFSGLDQGFDRMSAPDETNRDAADTIAMLSSWLDSAEGVPLFVWLHLFDPHAPYLVPEEYRRLYYPEDRDPYDPELPELPRRKQADWDRAVRDPEWILAQYRSQITYLDDRLAEFCSHPRFARAIIAFTADHGESLDAHGIYYNHIDLYPDTLHVPLILAWPGARGGERIGRPVRQIDVGRTLLDLAGVADASFPGTNLLEPGSAAASEPRFAISSHATSASIQSGPWYLILHLVAGMKGNGEPRPLHGIELYDLRADPNCDDEISADHPREAAALRASLASWLVAAQGPGFRGEQGTSSAEQMQRLAELGYADGAAITEESVWFDAECACQSAREPRTTTAPCKALGNVYATVKATAS